MGSIIEINDTLLISKEQGFPAVLNLEAHLKMFFVAEDFNNQIFEFKNKKGIRFYHAPPVRVFLVENIGGKWLYWGLVEMLEVNHNYQASTTSGKFKLLYIYTAEEMKQAHSLIDRNKDNNYFK